jgi:uncharacterized protein YigA (DUF484 family)
MTDASTPDNVAIDFSQKVNESSHKDVTTMSEIDVRNYLTTNPEFFQKHVDLLEKLKLSHPVKGSVSLVEMQSEQLRKRIKQLTQKLNQLISVAKQNEKIYRVYVALNLQLMACKTIEDVQSTLENVMIQELHLASVHVKPFKGPHALPELQQRLFIEKRFKNGPYFFGRLSQHEKQLIFAEEIAESVALVLIGEKTPLAILAVGSRDASHFAPSMDTLMLKQLQQMLCILLSDFYNY